MDTKLQISLTIYLFCISLMGHASDQQIKMALQGKWNAVSATSNGESAPTGMLEKMIFIFSGETVSIMGATPIQYKTNDQHRPAHIDFLNSRGQVGIYELKGNLLRLCVGQNGDRPSAFKTKKYTDHTCILLRRSGS